MVSGRVDSVQTVGTLDDWFGQGTADTVVGLAYLFCLQHPAAVSFANGAGGMCRRSHADCLRGYLWRSCTVDLPTSLIAYHSSPPLAMVSGRADSVQTVCTLGDWCGQATADMVVGLAYLFCLQHHAAVSFENGSGGICRRYHVDCVRGYIRRSWHSRHCS